MALPNLPADASATQGPENPPRSQPSQPALPQGLTHEEGLERLMGVRSPDPSAPPTPIRDESDRGARAPEQNDGSASDQGDGEPGSVSSESDASQGAEDTQLRLDDWAEHTGLSAEHFAEQFMVPVKVDGKTDDVTLKSLIDGHQIEKFNRQETSKLAERKRQLNEEFEAKQTQMSESIETIDQLAEYWDGLIENQRKENKTLLANGDTSAYLNAEAGLEELIKQQANVKTKSKEARNKQADEQRKHYDEQINRSVSEFRELDGMDDAHWGEFMTNAQGYLREAKIPERDYVIFARNPAMLRVLKDALQSHSGRKAKAKARASDVLNLPRGSASQPKQVTGDRQLNALNADFGNNPTLDSATDLLLGHRQARQRFQR